MGNGAPIVSDDMARLIVPAANFEWTLNPGCPNGGRIIFQFYVPRTLTNRIKWALLPVGAHRWLTDTP